MNELESYQTASKGMLDADSSKKLLNKSHKLETTNIELLGGLNTYKSLFDVAANQARTLKLTNKWRDDEEENLLYALREL